jgi:chlorophyllase
MYTVSGSDATVEIEEAVAILEWMPAGLIGAMPERFGRHRADFGRVALVGHSRGGKVVFGLGFGVRKSVHRYSAIVGLDPVDGTGVGAQTEPAVLRFREGALELGGVPALVVGTGLGAVRRNALFPPCAPEGVSHGAFFHDLAAPAVHVVASLHGHMDFLDDDCKGAIGKLSSCVCRNGPARKPMRRFAGGIVVAFLQAACLGEAASLDAALASPELAPVALARPEWKGKLAESFPHPTLAPALTQ